VFKGIVLGLKNAAQPTKNQWIKGRVGCFRRLLRYARNDVRLPAKQVNSLRCFAGFPLR